MTSELVKAVTHWAIVGDGNKVCARALDSRRALLWHNMHCECGRYDSGFLFLRRRALARWVDGHVTPRWRAEAIKQGRPRRKPR